MNDLLIVDASRSIKKHKTNQAVGQRENKKGVGTS